MMAQDLLQKEENDGMRLVAKREDWFRRPLMEMDVQREKVQIELRFGMNCTGLFVGNNVWDKEKFLRF